MMILFWILIGVTIYYLLMDSKMEKHKNINKKDSVETLKLRYVNGEIDEETYSRTLKVLND